jgi:hypothetical protein
MTRNRWGTHLHGATAWVASRPPEPAASVHLFIRPSVRPSVQQDDQPTRSRMP